MPSAIGMHLLGDQRGPCSPGAGAQVPGPVVPAMGAGPAPQFHVGVAKVASLYRSTKW